MTRKIHSRWFTGAFSFAQNRAVSCLLTCVYSCIACVEKLFTALSETAFIFSSLSGTNFLKSANLSIKFIFLNFSKISALHLVTNLISLIGVGFIFASTVALGWGLVGEYYPEISSPLYILNSFFFVSLLRKFFYQFWKIHQNRFSSVSWRMRNLITVRVNSRHRLSRN